MKYNYKTKKGFIRTVFTEDGDGYLHGKEVKKLANDEINVSHGSYTTCNNEEHPHFEFRFNKSKLIPNKKIITGPAYLVIEEVPTPLFIPFAMFPTQKGQRSGIVMPTYGESANRGFYLQNGGYYWGINDYVDFKLVGDIYSRGSWSLKPTLNYAVRYKYRGSFNFSYAINKIGDDDEGSKDFKIRWSHSQDAKARPNGRFSANVNIVTQSFNQFNPVNTQDYLSNQFSSSISYQTTIAGKYQLNISGNHSQSTKTQMVTVSLPNVTFSANRFYPFRRKERVGKLKWYENISMNYSMDAKNSITIQDSLLFSPQALGQFRNGIKHSIPIKKIYIAC